MRGSTIVLAGNPKGVFLEGVIADTSKPGTLMQIKAGIPLQGGEPTWIAAAPGTDGKAGLIAVLREDDLQGKTYADAYIAGSRCFLYCPIAGEDINVLVGEVAGTGNNFTIGDRLILDAEDGLLVPDAGSPQSTPFIAMETVVQAPGSSLLFVRYTGH